MLINDIYLSIMRIKAACSFLETMYLCSLSDVLAACYVPLPLPLLMQGHEPTCVGELVEVCCVALYWYCVVCSVALYWYSAVCSVALYWYSAVCSVALYWYSAVCSVEHMLFICNTSFLFHSSTIYRNIVLNKIN